MICVSAGIEQQRVYQQVNIAVGVLYEIKAKAVTVQNQLDKRLGVSASGNNEVRFLWLEAALRNRYQPAVPQAEEFLARVGRNKFVSPLFQALWNTGEWGQPIARRIYAATRGGYHAYTRGKVDAIVS